MHFTLRLERTIVSTWSVEVADGDDNGFSTWTLSSINAIHQVRGLDFQMIMGRLLHFLYPSRLYISFQNNNKGFDKSFRSCFKGSNTHFAYFVPIQTKREHQKQKKRETEKEKEKERKKERNI